jgi:hypothetical protein
MFSSGNQAVMISGILLALTFICGLLYFVNKMFANDTQEILVRFILLVFTALVGVWVVDKVIAFRIKLLDAEQGAQLFDLIKTLILMIFSYYFGSKKAVENKK